MSATQRARSGVPLAHRSALPTIPGVPAWGAVAIAVVATLIGFLIDSARGTELTAAFSVFYFLGCLAAVLAVRNRGLFTAMVQPPLLLVVAVPLAYQHFSPGGGGIKDLALNVAIPLVNRFPLMIGTTLVVVLLGAGRMYIRHQAASVLARRPSASRTTRRARTMSRVTADESDPADEAVHTSIPEAEYEAEQPDEPARAAHAAGSFPTGRYPARARYSGPPDEDTTTFDRPRPAEPVRRPERPPQPDRRERSPQQHGSRVEPQPYEPRPHEEPQPFASRSPEPRSQESRTQDSRSHERRPQSEAVAHDTRHVPRHEPSGRRSRTARYETQRHETQQYEAPRYETQQNEASRYETQQYETPQYETQQYERRSYGEQYEAPRHERQAHEHRPRRRAREEADIDARYRGDDIDGTPGRRHRHEASAPRHEARHHEAPAPETTGRHGADVPLHPLPRVRYRDRRDQEPPYEYQ